MPIRRDLPRVLLALRLGVFLVMFMWTLDKVIRPEHAARVFDSFYDLHGLGRPAFLALGAAELLLLLAFVTGMWKRATYGLVLLLHGVSTLSSYRQYLEPFDGPNLLFYAAWPMLAAAWGLYLLRDEDVLGTVGRRRDWSIKSRPRSRRLASRDRDVNGRLQPWWGCRDRLGPPSGKQVPRPPGSCDPPSPGRPI